MHLLDTDTLSHLHAGNERAAQRLQECTDVSVGVPVICRAEMLRGRIEFLLKAADKEEVLRAQEWLARTEEFLSRLKIVPLDERAADLFEKLRGVKKLKKMGRADLLIACLALAHDAVLVTRNLKHFALVPGLKCVNWVD